jgi:HSP20 family molecular chaperone IbpA
MKNTMQPTNEDTRTTKTENAQLANEPTRSQVTYRPNVDILESEGELQLRADLPGVAADDIDVQFENGVLTLTARVRPRWNMQKAAWRLQEYGLGDFQRTFQVGEQIDASGITAEYGNGILTLHLPKVAAVRPRRIAVRAG